MAIVLGYNNCYCSFRGALAEELGKGLQNPVHECESRTRLHIPLTGKWASGGIGIRDGLKIRWQNKPCGFKSHLAHHLRFSLVPDNAYV